MKAMSLHLTGNRILRTLVRSTLALLTLLAGCTGPLKIPTEVKVPVPVPCINAADRPQRPDLATDADLLAMDRYKRTWALWGDRAEREVYQARLEAVVDGCSKIPPINR